MKTQHPEGGNDEKVARKGVGKGGNMASDKKESANVNVTLSLKHIQKYFDVLSSGTAAGDLGKTKENAEAALEYLTYIFESKVGDMLTARPCGPKPNIPELP
jgi:hypothetical protein